MVYVLAVDGVVQKYPYTLTDLRRDNPEVSFPSEITDEIAGEYDVYYVEEIVQPVFNSEIEMLIWVNPTFQGGKWVQQWRVDPLPQSEINARLENWRQSASCSPFQGKAALFNAGLLDEVETLISATQTSTIVKLAWANASEWRRMSAMITSLASELSLTDEEVDDLFKAAVLITA